MENFKLELLGGILMSSYIAWLIWSIIGSVIASLARNHLTTLKSYPVNIPQLLLGVLLTFAFIRFSLWTNYVPDALGAFLIGFGGNELALSFLKKYLKRKEDASNESLESTERFIGDRPTKKD